MYRLTRKTFNQDKIIADGTTFLIGNGHIGFRGGVEEFSRDQKVALNLVGAYDQYQDLWKESINVPNPFHVQIFHNEQEQNILNQEIIRHTYALDLKRATMKRKTNYGPVTVTSTKFCDVNHVENGQMLYQMYVEHTGEIEVFFSIDLNVWDINGPHLYLKDAQLTPYLLYHGVTNENKHLAIASYVHSKQNLHGVRHFLANKITKGYAFHGEAGKTYSFIVAFDVRFGDVTVVEQAIEGLHQYRTYGLARHKKDHQMTWLNRWWKSDVQIVGSRKADFALRYSIYHLWILAPTKYITSIPARGLSGQTYKGAIFWDTEIFIEPFFSLVEPEITRKLILYRIQTLNGAKSKARQFGYDGAFYAWESQDTGLEACSLYNVADAVTGKPVRTYFADKQIHISGDVAYSILQYIDLTGDRSILFEGGLKTLFEIFRFYLSYATYDAVTDSYHLLDVIGPDEYHERIDDNAFTNYLVNETIHRTQQLLMSLSTEETILVETIRNDLENFSWEKILTFAKKLYLPKPNDQGIIEQFTGYFSKEDVSLDTVRKRLKNENEYWGGEHGVATPTKIIKQADVATLLVLFKDRFTQDIKMKNFDYYESKTEHGSSLSACMYSLLACAISRPNFAYHFFLKSALIDLLGGGKKFAGAIYIGGSHPASNGGSYLSLIYGFAGLSCVDKKFHFIPQLPKQIRELRFKVMSHGKRYAVVINKESVIQEELYD